MSLAPAASRAAASSPVLDRLGAFARAGALYAALLLIMTAPAWIWPVPRAGDLVNHWARLTLLAEPRGSALASGFDVHFGLIPNLGIDLLYLALSPVLAPEAVVRIAWALCFVLPAWGAWRLSRALFGAPQLAVLLAPALSYNLLTTTGLVNIGMGAGLALLALTWRAGRAPRADAADFIVLNLVSLALLACHILALGMFCLAFGLMEAMPGDGESWRTGALRALRAPLFALAGLALTPFLEKTPTTLAFTGAKLQALTAPVFALSRSDLPLAAALVACLVLAWRSGLLGFARPARLAAAVILAIVLLAPSAYKVGVLLDARLAVFGCFFALGATRWEWRGRAAMVMTVVALGLCLARFAALAPEWSAYNATAISVREAFAAVPRGARALSLRPPDGACADSNVALVAGLAPFATIDRGAFVNAVFALPGMQPVRPTDAALAEAPNMAIPANWLEEHGQARLGWMRDTDWARALLDWRAHFDTILAFHASCAWRPEAPDLERIAASPAVDVYRVKRAD